MNPTTYAVKLIWEMLAVTVTLAAFLLFAYELSQGRQLAKAKQAAAKR